MIPFASLNYVAIFVAAFATFVFASLWYGPILGKSWMKLTGMKKNDPSVNMTSAMLSAFVTSFIISVFTAYFVSLTAAATWVAGAVSGFWLGLGILAPAMYADVVWTKKPCKLFLIDAVFRIIQTSAIGAIYVAMV